ncbi:TerC family protein [Geomonas sp. Red32]|uniref:TerC family protein n=1 Tax=Geomonas sp. Red32 TaxID=2912856 RepID=UPI00202CF0EE|nr:TerC family protein [Geomonas sp. Red32]MCM0081231.1 TerC family protein [Geomonas sp. Red32]
MTVTATMWIVFAVLFGVMLLIDLGLNRKSHHVSFKEAGAWSAVWILLALTFNAAIYFTMGSARALEFFTGYVIEKSLSVDNLFVFIMIFSYFGVRGEHQARVLKWGIIGALIMRIVFILAGIQLLERFHVLFYLFGAALVVTGIKMAFGGQGEPEPEANFVVRAVRSILPVTKRTRGDWFITRRRGVLVASPLLVALVLIEWSDLIFALDSIPAVLAITLDPFVVITSNIFAIMGLRSLYFLLAGVMGMFVYLKYAIAFVLVFVGGKMIAGVSGWEISTPVSLAVIFVSLATAIAVSLLHGKRK